MEPMGSARACQKNLFSSSQQRISTNKVGLYKRIGTGDRSIYMTLCRKMYKSVDFMIGQSFPDSLTIANISLDKNDLTGFFQRRKARSISCIGQGVVNNDPILGVTFTPVIHEVGANEAGTSGDK